MNSRICGAEQVRIKKLVDIWERGSTFPATMLSQFQEKLNARNANGKNLHSSRSSVFAKKKKNNRKFP